jgi:hypothetical protein
MISLCVHLMSEGLLEESWVNVRGGPRRNIPLSPSGEYRYHHGRQSGRLGGQDHLAFRQGCAARNGKGP